MSKEELLEYLREHLSIRLSVNSDRDYYSDGFRVKVELALDDEVISESIDTMQWPERD